MKMKQEEKQRKFHEALLKMLYPSPSQLPSDNKDEKKEDDQTESNSIESLNGLPEDEIDNEEQSPSNSDDNSDDGKMTRAQRKRHRKRKLMEAAAQRIKIIGPLLPPGSDDGVDGSHHGSAKDASNVAEGVRVNAATNVSGDLNHGEEEALCSKKNKLKLKQRRKLKKMVVTKSTPSSTSNQNHGLKITVDDKGDS